MANRKSCNKIRCATEEEEEEEKRIRKKYSNNIYLQL